MTVNQIWRRDNPYREKDLLVCLENSKYSRNFRVWKWGYLVTMLLFKKIYVLLNYIAMTECDRRLDHKQPLGLDSLILKYKQFHLKFLIHIIQPGKLVHRYFQDIFLSNFKNYTFFSCRSLTTHRWRYCKMVNRDSTTWWTYIPGFIF